MKSLKGLAFELGTSIKELDKITKEIDKYYYEFDKKKVKNDGTIKTRKIEPSTRKLKKIQKAIARLVIKKIPLLPNVQGGVKGRCNITNAKLHIGKKYHFCTDLKKFFPSVRHNQVYQAFIENGFSPKIANLLTKLTTYKGKLPQGTPSSTAIANMVLKKADSEILKICKQHKITYSRFVDDLVLSSQSCFKNIQQEFIDIITVNGFRISHGKSFYKVGPVEVTGVLVKQNKLDITKAIEQKLNLPLNPKSKKGLENYVARIKKA